MAHQLPFNPSSQVRFDIGRGQVSMDGDTWRLLVPAEALLELCRAAGPEATKSFARRLGTEIGRRVAGRLAGGPERASLEAVVEHLGGDLALVGLGSLSVERWGAALVFRVSNSPAGADSLLAAVLEGALQRALSRDASLVPLERADGSVRLLVVRAETAQKVRGWLEGGVAWGEALSRLSVSK
jgi:hypothetical protein